LPSPSASERVGLLLHADDTGHQEIFDWEPTAVAAWTSESPHRGERALAFRRNALISKTPILVSDFQGLTVEGEGARHRRNRAPNS